MQDSSRVGPHEWKQLASLLDENRKAYDAFIVVHGTDTMAYTASALSLMLAGFAKPIVVTGDTIGPRLKQTIVLFCSLQFLFMHSIEVVSAEL